MSGENAAVCHKCDKAFTSGVKVEGLGFHCLPCAKEIENERCRPVEPKRPPRGVTPRYIIDDQRLSDLKTAIIEHAADDSKILAVWIDEYHEILDRSQKRRINRELGRS